MRRIVSDRGSVFILCRRSAEDSRFPKYPRLPVIGCAGFEAEPDARDKNPEKPVR
jgi:hypothetical protein